MNQSFAPQPFLLCMPLEPETLSLLSGIPDEGRRIFWSSLYRYFVSGKGIEFVSHIASKFLEYDRPLAAINAIAQVFHGGVDTSNLNSNLVASILIRIATNPTDIDIVTLQYVRHDILEAIAFLQDSGGMPESDIQQIEWTFLKFFSFEDFTPRFLMKSVSEDPSFFVQLVTWAFKRKDHEEETTEDISEELKNQRAEKAYDLLKTIFILPGVKGDEIDFNILSEWVKVARMELAKVDRKDIGDDRIGTFLSNSPIGKDGIWPHEAVRSIIEYVRSRKLDLAIHIGFRNSRGMTSRNPHDGGEQERVLAKKYYLDAESIQLVYPRTADIIRAIARSYEWDADREDREVELNE